MKKLFLTLVCAIFAISVFQACKKTADNGCPEISASVTTPVQAGGTIQLSAPNYDNVAFYHWTGPNGFESSDQNPVITNAQSDYAGRYTLEVGILDGCTRTVKTDSVIITVPPSPCNPANNTAVLNGQSMTFSPFTGGSQGGSYFINAYGGQGDIELEFPGTKRPSSGMYNIEPLTGSWLYGAVRVRFVANSSNWPASSGKVYLTVNNGKITATFCSVPVFNQTFSFAATGSARITEK